MPLSLAIQKFYLDFLLYFVCNKILNLTFDQSLNFPAICLTKKRGAFVDFDIDWGYFFIYDIKNIKNVQWKWQWMAVNWKELFQNCSQGRRFSLNFRLVEYFSLNSYLIRCRFCCSSCSSPSRHLRTICLAYLIFSFMPSVIPSLLSFRARNVCVEPSWLSKVIAFIFGQKTTFSCDSNQFTCMEPLDSHRQMAVRVRNHVRR